MRSTATFVVGVFALASSAVAQKAGWAVVTSPAKNQEVPTGETFNIEWTAGKGPKGPVTISLMGGPDQGGQQTIGDLTTSVDVAAGSYAWMVDCALGTENIYGLTITSNADEDTFQYSFPFHIKKSEQCAGNSDDTSSSTSAPTSSTSIYSATPMPTSSSSVLSTTTTTSSTSSSASMTSSTTVMTTPTGSTIISATLPTETLPTSTPTGTTLSQAPTNTWTTSVSSASSMAPTSTTPTGSTSASPSASPSSSTIPDNGAAARGASSLALIGGLVVAALAL